MIISETNQIDAAETNSPSRPIFKYLPSNIYISIADPVLSFVTRIEIELQRVRGSA